jgi:hypothetical protein
MCSFSGEDFALFRNCSISQYGQPGWQGVMRRLDLLQGGLRLKPGAGKPAARRPSKPRRKNRAPESARSLP